jgi:hypothetical protein
MWQPGGDNDFADIQRVNAEFSQPLGKSDRKRLRQERFLAGPRLINDGAIFSYDVIKSRKIRTTLL